MQIYSVIILISIVFLLWFYMFFVFRNSWESKEVVVKPKKGGKLHVPKFMLELYEKNKDLRVVNNTADVVRSLIPTHAGKHDEYVEEFTEKHVIEFDLPVINEDEVFLSAELKILTIISNQDFGFVRRTLNLLFFDDNSKEYTKLSEEEISQRNNTWLSFNVTKSVQKQYFQGKSTCLRLMISVKTYFPHVKNNFRLSLMPETENYDHEYPVLMLSYSSLPEKPPKIRSKRSIEEDYEEDTNLIWDEEIPRKLRKTKKRVLCRRRPLYIDFTEIEYDIWIVQPNGYEAYQCQGRCFYPVAEHLNPTKHAIVQALLHSVSPSKVSRSCCVPTLLDSISILYVDSKGILTYRYAYKDMVVKECGCR